MAVMKSESDGKHPASHYLVVEDANAPSTWHLRVRDVDGKVDHRLMGAAWAALHEGYRGNKYAGPDKEKALEKLKALYDREGMAEPGEREESAHMEKAAKAIATLDDDWVWVGVSHNAYQDRLRDTFPYRLIEKDWMRQEKAIQEGKLPDFGPCLADHKYAWEIGRATFKAIVPGTRMVMEAGPIASKWATMLEGKVWPMSIGYGYNEDHNHEYTEFMQHERGPMIKKSPANLLTRFKVYKRAAATPDVLAQFSGETP